MKDLFLTALAGASLLLSACQTAPENVLKDNASRANLYHEILNNHEYTQQLMDSFHSNPHGKMMMAEMHKGDQEKSDKGDMMKDMMKNMMSKSETDTTMAKDMCGKMCESKNMTDRMLTMLHEKGIVDDACYKKGMEKVKSIAGQMPSTDAKTQEEDEHASHH